MGNRIKLIRPSTVFGHLAHVFSVCAYLQVGHFTASTVPNIATRIVARAKVQYFHPFGDRAMSLDICESRGQNCLMTGKPDLAVAVAPYRTHPKTASGWLNSVVEVLEKLHQGWHDGAGVVAKTRAIVMGASAFRMRGEGPVALFAGILKGHSHHPPVMIGVPYPGTLLRRPGLACPQL